MSCIYDYIKSRARHITDILEVLLALSQPADALFDDGSRPVVLFVLAKRLVADSLVNHLVDQLVDVVVGKAFLKIKYIYIQTFE